MMKIAVTGSDGYIAKGVIERLLAIGHTVEAFGLAPCGVDHPCLQEWIGDVFEHDFLGEPPDILLHLAWRDGFNHNALSHLEDLPKHYALLIRAIEAGVPRVAVMGTMHEVGYHEGAVREDTPCWPTTPYGVAKNALRQLACELCRQKGIKLQWMRGFYLVSADGRGSSIFAKLVQADRDGQLELPFTSGRCRYDFLSYDDFCDQVVAILEQDEVCGIINVCSGEAIALGDYIERFIYDNELKVRLGYGKYPDRPYDSPAIWGDNAKIKAVLAARNFDD